MKGLYGQFACAMPRDERMVAVGYEGRIVYYEAALYCRENLTDGVIARSSLMFWTPDMPMKRKVAKLDHLADEGALERIEVGWRIPWNVWCEWNPTKVEVDEKRRQEAERKAEWRAKKAAKSDASPDDVPMGQARLSRGCPAPVPDSQRQRQSQSHKPQTEPEPISLSSVKQNITSRAKGADLAEIHMFPRMESA